MMNQLFKAVAIWTFLALLINSLFRVDGNPFDDIDLVIISHVLSALALSVGFVLVETAREAYDYFKNPSHNACQAQPDETSLHSG